MSIGTAGNGPTGSLSTTQPYDNLMLTPGILGTVGPLQPLTEGAVNGLNAETPSSGMANSIRAADASSRPIVVSGHGINGALYSEIKRGGTQAAYANGQTQALAAKTAVQARGGVYRPLAVTVIHGEGDSTSNASFYQGYLQEWQANYQQDLNTLSGATGTLPMFISQMNASNFGDLAQSQYQAHLANTGKIVLVGPKYQYAYSPDHLHMTQISYKHHGEMFGKVIKKVAIDNTPWQPLRPTGASRSGNRITLSFLIPVGTLNLDTTTVAQRQNYGFEFVQTGGNSVSISNVTLSADKTQVYIDLSATPSGSNPRVRYAWTCNDTITLPVEACANAATANAVGGNIRDSDTSVSAAIGATGLPLYNWLITFEQSVN